VLQLIVETRDASAVEDACFAAGALSVTLLDAADEPILEPAPGATPLWPSVRLVALFARDASRESIQASLAVALGQHVAVNFELVEDRVWEREWLKDFRPMRFGARLWVCPQDQEPGQPDATVVWLDPGLAFGTGTHETTAMCLSWLDSADLQDCDVVDFRCGSGILAISALRLGARQAAAMDLDPQALIATRENARRNGVDALIVPVDAAIPLCDVLLANILAEPLISLAARLAASVRRNGQIVLSGILTAQAPDVARAFAPWFDMRTAATRNDWVCLEGARR